MNDIDDIRIAIEPALNKLKGLPTAADIRDFLVSEEIRAYPWSSNRCAIAEYILRESNQTVSVGQGTVNTHYTTCDVVDEIGVNSFAMAEFIANFDRGDYPELVVPAFEAY